MSARPVRVGDVYQVGSRSFEITAFDLMGPWPVAIGVLGDTKGASETRVDVLTLAGFKLMSGGTGQAVEIG